MFVRSYSGLKPHVLALSRLWKLDVMVPLSNTLQFTPVSGLATMVDSNDAVEPGLNADICGPPPPFFAIVELRNVATAPDTTATPLPGPIAELPLIVELVTLIVV